MMARTQKSTPKCILPGKCIDKPGKKAKTSDLESKVSESDKEKSISMRECREK